MKLKKWEWAAIAVTGLVLAAAVGYQLGLRRSRAEVLISAERFPPAEEKPEAPAAEAPELRAMPEMPEETPEKAMVDVNSAGSEELKTLTGVGEVLAQRIIAYRSANGAFTRLEDLLKVEGIGESLLAKNRDRILID